MKKTAQNSSSPQENHEPQEKLLIAEIAERLNQKNGLALEIGEKIDALIRLKGGIQYGEKTIETLSQEPEIQCLPKTLRRYWGYYRVASRYGDMIRQIHSDLKTSYYYELARLLDNDGKAVSAAADQRISKQIAKYVAWKVAQDKPGCRHVTVDQFRQEISDDLNAAAKTSTTKSDKKKPDPKPKSRIGRLLTYNDEGLELMAGYFAEFAAPKHLASLKPNPGRVGHQINRMAESLAALIDYLLSTQETAEISPATPTTLIAAANKLNSVLVKAETLAKAS